MGRRTSVVLRYPLGVVAVLLLGLKEGTWHLVVALRITLTVVFVVFVILFLRLVLLGMVIPFLPAA
jgi:hypothetical protein